MHFLCAMEIAVNQGKMEFLIGQSSQFVNLFWFKGTFSGVIWSKQAWRILLARATEGVFYRYVNSENCELGFTCGREVGREGKGAENFHFTAQTCGWIGTAVVPGMPESRQNILSTTNFLSFQPLPLTQPSELQEAKSRWHKANYMRLIIWLCCSRGDGTSGFCRGHGKGRGI